MGWMGCRLGCDELELEMDGLDWAGPDWAWLGLAGARRHDMRNRGFAGADSDKCSMFTGWLTEGLDDGQEDNG